MTDDETTAMLQGWQDDLEYQQLIARRMTIIISDVTNKTMGGKGVDKAIRSMWPLSVDRQEDSQLLQKLDRLKASGRKRKKKHGSAGKS